ncbi:EAL domain-containing protein [Desulfurispirillum indicum]|uniref:EAL domain protein n=1 Tax=Desulfurispirillum indicum (strain ATCC BAA-1389 / DSM 22839 / S5) TaxID=653733 RepID=E6W5J9_DESIS|nr:EAL domain-containing protein [Desulfurispirillum indicum]ADU66030.1 EAL domain protein [Desulfurispirillum indicum S5]UCZ57968.1 EAL domain-containing protein [Desulfurispirillum indicum]
MSEVFIGRQPIIDADQQVFAYELFFRQGMMNRAIISDDKIVNAKMMANILGNFGTKKVLGDRPGFINVDTAFFSQDFVDIIPKDQLVLEILAKTDVDEKFLAKMDAYKQNGFRFALGDFEFENWYIERFGPLIKKANYIKIDLQKVTIPRLAQKIPILKKLPAKLVAEKVESWDIFHECKKIGFHYFQGYFYAQPEVLRSEEYNPSKAPILRILRLINQNSEPSVIEHEFKGHPELSYTLLRYMNSGAMNFTTPIRSIGHAIKLLGLKKLKSWLMLLNFAYPDSGTASQKKKKDVIFETALMRAKLMEELLIRYSGGKYAPLGDSAFFLGILSLVDTVIGISKQELVKNILLPAEMAQALLTQKGLLGRLLFIVIAEEQRHHSEMYDALESLGISPVTFDEAVNASHEWLNDFINNV